MRDEPGELPFGRIAFKTEVREKKREVAEADRLKESQQKVAEVIPPYATDLSSGTQEVDVSGEPAEFGLLPGQQEINMDSIQESIDAVPSSYLKKIFQSPPQPPKSETVKPEPEPEPEPEPVKPASTSADVSDYRRVHLKEIAKKHGSILKLSEKLGYSNASFLVQMIGPNPTRVITEKSARKFETALHLRQGSLDIPVKNCEHVTLGKMSPQSEEGNSVLNTKEVFYTVNVMKAVHELCKNAKIELPISKFITLTQQALLTCSANSSDETIELSTLEPLIELLKPS